MKDKNYYVYFMMNFSNTVIYVGVTNDLARRVYEHKNKLIDGFTKKYNVNKLVYYEEYDDPLIAIAREKQIKAGSRDKKMRLIAKDNPRFEDLYDGLFG
ncbi:MAG: GIY-YIG nuclease family protein [bacterium]|nr:GIY-YIG nuclease family protein [bacterium]